MVNERRWANSFSQFLRGRIRSYFERIQESRLLDAHFKPDAQPSGSWTQKESLEVQDLPAKYPNKFDTLRTRYQLLRERQSRPETTADQGSGQVGEIDHKEKAKKDHHNLMVRPEWASKKTRKHPSLLSHGQQDEDEINSTTPSPHRSFESDHTSAATSDVPRRHQQALPIDLSDDGEAALYGDQEQAPSLSSNLSGGLLRDSTIPRRPRSERRTFPRKLQKKGASAPKQSIDLLADSLDVKTSGFSGSYDEQGRQIRAELDKVTQKVIKAFQRHDQSFLPAQEQGVELGKAIFDAHRKLKQEIIKNEPHQARRQFFRLNSSYEKVIGRADYDLYKSLASQQYNMAYRRQEYEEWKLKQRKFYSRRYGPSSKWSVMGLTPTPKQAEARDQLRNYQNLQTKMKRLASHPSKHGPERKPWSQEDTNLLYKLLRERPGLKSLRERFDEFKYNIPPEYWRETTSGASSPHEGGDKEVRSESKPEKGKMVVGPSRYKRLRMTEELYPGDEGKLDH
ncbi:hypothetical protein FA10DRAFT_145549 [Acaromyces ingoldii]|uniref:Uncharacterized protein n=1 Tax=Acaromyces ingoldii TaxID=215250 RepID=A0A316YLB7_9BASI|nr:hypothetical protein FA10DRAFT_145549 [Acaromyces ingoldii]PWN89448.1 hypothetical protein FA10DRAFT_145549 [Acaromyces ingoldii]